MSWVNIQDGEPMSSVLTKLNALGVLAYSSSTTHTTTKVTANHSATAVDDVILCDATLNAIVVTLPVAASSANLRFHIKKTDTSAKTVTIVGDGGALIDGASSVVITSQYETVTVQCDGTAWWVL